MKRWLRHWFRRITGSHRDQIARRMRQERESLHWWDVPEREPEASPLDFWDGNGVGRTEKMARVLDESRQSHRVEHPPAPR